jgi:uncharacterized protein YihD (DUF1040 family)
MLTIKEEVAIALLLWRDYKSQGIQDLNIITLMFKIAKAIGVSKELEDMMSKFPPMKITPRD